MPGYKTCSILSKDLFTTVKRDLLKISSLSISNPSKALSKAVESRYLLKQVITLKT